MSAPCLPSRRMLMKLPDCESVEGIHAESRGSSFHPITLAFDGSLQQVAIFFLRYSSGLANG